GAVAADEREPVAGHDGKLGPGEKLGRADAQVDVLQREERGKGHCPPVYRCGEGGAMARPCAGAAETGHDLRARIANGSRLKAGTAPGWGRSRKKKAPALPRASVSALRHCMPHRARNDRPRGSGMKTKAEEPRIGPRPL